MGGFLKHALWKNFEQEGGGGSWTKSQMWWTKGLEMGNIFLSLRNTGIDFDGSPAKFKWGRIWKWADEMRKSRARILPGGCKRQ